MASAGNVSLADTQAGGMSGHERGVLKHGVPVWNRLMLEEGVAKRYDVFDKEAKL